MADGNGNNNNGKFPLERTIFVGSLMALVWFAGWLFTNVSDIKTQNAVFEIRLSNIERVVRSTNNKNVENTSSFNSNFSQK